MTINSSSCLRDYFATFFCTMPIPGTPDAATKPSSVTPGTALAGERILGAGFDPDILDIMVTLIDPEDPTTNDAVKEGLNELFTRHWRTKLWYNLKFFSSADVVMALSPDGPGPDALKEPVIVRKLSVIIDYAGLDQSLTADSDLDDMMKQVKNAKQNKNILYGFFRLLFNFGQGGRRYPALAAIRAKDLLGVVGMISHGWMRVPEGTLLAMSALFVVPVADEVCFWMLS